MKDKGFILVLSAIYFVIIILSFIFISSNLNNFNLEKTYKEFSQKLNYFNLLTESSDTSYQADESYWCQKYIISYNANNTLDNHMNYNNLRKYCGDYYG